VKPPMPGFLSWPASWIKASVQAATRHHAGRGLHLTVRLSRAARCARSA
jgi:hypothetical protein